jgi:hypothetical protein
MGQGEGFGGAYCYAEGWVGLNRGNAESGYVLKITNIAKWPSKSGLHENDVQDERVVKRPCSNCDFVWSRPLSNSLSVHLVGNIQ